MRRWLLLLVAALLLTASNASANGRFPAANGVVVAPGRPELVLARVTFGLLLSRDGGRTWTWICERAIGFNGVEDPAYAIAGDGSLLAGTFNGVRYSNDGGCAWSSADGIGKELIVDTASRWQEPKSVVALASGFEGQGDAGELRFRNFVFESTDDGKTFTALGKRLDPLLLAQTIETAESDPQRIYISATAELGVPSRNTGFVLISKDHGSTFTRTTIELEPLERAPYVAAVDPHDANRLYVRTGGAPDKPSRILLSEDGGKRFRTVHRSKGPLLGFALSPDGSKIFAGGPADGLIVASTKDHVFTTTSEVQVQCLRATEKALWVCSNEASGFVLATTEDLGAHFDVRLHMHDLAGPLSCPAESPVTRECASEWARLRNDLGIKAPQLEAPPPAPPPPVKPLPSSASLGRWAAGATFGLLIVITVLGLRRRRQRGS